MIVEILNWFACVLTILGTWEVSKLHPNMLKVNFLYCLGSFILLGIFLFQQNYSMTSMYLILLMFAFRGMINHQKRELEKASEDIDEYLKLRKILQDLD